jgi:lambda family phage portal protein
LRWRSWELYRNNGDARKLVRSLEARVVGTGLCPEPQVLRRSGEPFEEANRAISALFDRFAKRSDYLGDPGRGGQSWVGQCKTVLRSTILSGDVLAQNMPVTDDLPVRVKLIHGERLADGFMGNVTLAPTNYVFRGVEFNSSGRRVAYWVYPVHPGASLDFRGFSSISNLEAVRVDVATNDVIHPLFMEDVDQVRGVPWFAPILMNARNVSDYTEDELRAAALSACIVAGYRLPTGATSLGGMLPQGWDGTDGDGNQITTIPSGAFLNLGKDGSIEGFAPNRPNAQAEGFVQFLLRRLAAGFPGTKSSTVTGDYRNSSFSSERSAENDAWPEVEGIQEWLCESYCQPTYNRVVQAGFESGLLPSSILAQADPNSLFTATWSGPVALSINPIDDAEASSKRIKIGQSSPQKEAAQVGTKWRENIDETAAYIIYFIAKMKAAGVSEENIDAAVAELLGGKPLPPPPPATPGKKLAGAA